MLSKKINIIEVCPRDGLQNIEKFIHTETKLELVKYLVEAGFKKMQVTSFVNPKAVPQMKDAREVAVKAVENYPDVMFTALVPNLFGAKAAYESDIREISYVISASEAHNKENVRRSINESFEELSKIRDKYEDLIIKLDIATAFGCPFLGEVSVNQIIRMIDTAFNIGVDDIFLADTIGVANPKQVGQVLTSIKSEYPDKDFGLHLHDTKGMGLANVVVALEKGITTFESAAGGLGGCPFAPGAAGNIASEDLINMIEQMNMLTGVNLNKLLNATDFIRTNIKENLTGHLANICKKN